MSVGKNSFSSTQKNVLGVLSQGAKWPRHKADHPFQYNIQTNNKCSHTSNPPLRLHSATETNLCIRAIAVLLWTPVVFAYISQHLSLSNRQNCLLRSIKHGHVFRPLRGHLQAITSYQFKLNFQVYFRVVRSK